MDVIFSIPETQSRLINYHRAGKKIGFVPTMGALHAGHASLVARSAAENDITVASVFVNPTQFGPHEDFSRYPRTLEADVALLKEVGCDLVFAPNPEDMYPTGRPGEIVFGLSSLDRVLCGASRPGHFNGVVQVVSKLFNIAQPHRAYFGEKDFQQLTILRTLAQELFFPLEVVGCPIIREDDGLAMSSRNRYMNAEERAQALYLITALRQVREQAQSHPETAILAQGVESLRAAYPAIRPDYFDIRSEDGLRALPSFTPADKPRAFIAAFCGTTRLIDNLPLY